MSRRSSDGYRESEPPVCIRFLRNVVAPRFHEPVRRSTFQANAGEYLERLLISFRRPKLPIRNRPIGLTHAFPFLAILAAGE